MAEICEKKLMRYKFCAENFFILKFLQFSLYIDDSNELISYERGVAQLGSAGALGVTDYTGKKYCDY